MPPFRFRLSTLLRVREAERDDRRAQLLDAQRAAEIVRNRLDEIDGELRNLRKMNQLSTKPGRLNVDQLLDYQRYELQTIAERAAVDEQLQKILREVERRRELLVAADREVRVLEKLREQQQEQHHRDELRVTQRGDDETAGRLSLMREESEL